MERKHKIKDGHIVVENPLFQELPTHEVTIKSGRTLYRFTGSYDGERSLPQTASCFAIARLRNRKVFVGFAHTHDL